MKFRRHLSLLLLVAILLSPFGLAVPAHASDTAQTDTPEIKAQNLLEQMTPEERVGQLFLVSFIGTDTKADSQIFDLVTRCHIGGVILLAENDNFSDTPGTVSAAYQLISALQIASWDYAQGLVTQPSGTRLKYNFIPLFIGIKQDGDGYPDDQILSELTTLPDLMSIGATWDLDLAEKTGALAGQELSAVGFNLYLGPSMDVLEYPSSSAGSGLGATVFGGDPYWVGALGGSYISGIHIGSNGRMAVIAKHFPGRGSADRPSGDEVATVRKSLEQLKQIELAPFFAVTGNASTVSGVADGLLVSHIRYQGFQGNIRATTRPVSFDSSALSDILSLPAFSTWRLNGGLMVSDDLGSNTVRRFYDPTGQSFSARIVVRDAFLAGNDLLYLGNVVSSDQPDSYNTVIQIVDFFSQKYREDPAFEQRVDSSVLRILTLKYRLYDDFNLATVITPETSLATLGQSESIPFEVASRSATLISPDPVDLAAVLPNPPDERDHIVFLTDTHQKQQCSTCAIQPVMAVDALQNAVLHLYGPQGVNLINPARMVSYPFNDLPSIFQDGVGNSTLEYDLRLAEWVVISMLESDPSQPDMFLRRFLSERQDLLREKNIIVFAFNAPYYLDATDISKLTSYYGLYSKSPPFIEIAARILFQEIPLTGALPVSVPGIGYDLLSETAPDPTQVIELYLDTTSTPVITDSGTTVPFSTPVLRVGDTINIRTGIILDHNGRPVPDGTGVRFSMNQAGDNDIIQLEDSTTTHGVAMASFSIDRAGLLEIRATSDPASISVLLQIEITPEGINITALPPTPIAGVVTPTPQISSLPSTNSSPRTTGRPGLGGWLMMLFVLSGSSLVTGWLIGKYITPQWGLRCTLCLIISGLASYCYLAFSLPGATAWLQRYGYFGILWVALAGVLIGLAAGVIWWRIRIGPDGK